MIQVRTLGVLGLARDGAEVAAELKWRKNSALLVYLARSPGLRRTRAHLCGLLWPDKPEAAARHSLNEALRILRRELGDDAVAADARDVGLAEGAVALDTEGLESACASGDWEAAAALIEGPFLDGFEVPDASRFEDWLGTERARWRGRSIEALTRCADERYAVGDVPGGTRAAQRALALDPLSDLAAQVAIRGAALAGDRGAALELYAAFTAALARELGGEPAPETQRLADRVRRERTWKLPEALRATEGSTSRPVLVGREVELARLLETWQTASRGVAALIALEGETGVGKSRLLEEVASRARLDGAHVAAIRAVPGDREAAWSGLLGLCRGGIIEAPGLWDASPRALAAVGAELPEWRERFADRIGGTAPAPWPRGFAELIRVACQEQPLLLVIDDAEWLDERSAGALSVLLRDHARRPLALAMAVEGPEGRARVDALQGTLASETPCLRLAVSRWTAEACRELVAQALPEFDPSARDRLARRVEADSAGLPLLAVSLVRAVRGGLELDDGSLGGAWPDTNRTLEQTMPGDLPDAVRAAIRVGFRRLSPEAQTFLSAASLLGERFDPERAAALVELAPPAWRTALEELEWHRWLYAEARGYSFPARIVRRVIGEDMLTPGQRRRLEERLVDAA